MAWLSKPCWRIHIRTWFIVKETGKRKEQMGNRTIQTCWQTKRRIIRKRKRPERNTNNFLSFLLQTVCPTSTRATQVPTRLNVTSTKNEHVLRTQTIGNSPRLNYATFTLAKWFSIVRSTFVCIFPPPCRTAALLLHEQTKWFSCFIRMLLFLSWNYGIISYHYIHIWGYPATAFAFQLLFQRKKYKHIGR